MRPKNFIITELNGNAVNIDGELDGVYFMVDLLRERAGYLTFDISVEEDCLIDIGYGEHLTDLRTRTSVGIRNFACSYYAKSGRNTFTHYFTRFAGRYIQVHVYSKKVSVNYFGLKNAIYPLKVINEPTGLDSLEKQIYKVSIDTLRLCMKIAHGVNKHFIQWTHITKCLPATMRLRNLTLQRPVSGL